MFHMVLSSFLCRLPYPLFLAAPFFSSFCFMFSTILYTIHFKEVSSQPSDLIQLPEHTTLSITRRCRVPRRLPERGSVTCSLNPPIPVLTPTVNHLLQFVFRVFHVDGLIGLTVLHGNYGILVIGASIHEEGPPCIGGDASNNINNLLTSPSTLISDHSTLSYLNLVS
jgi:hypothetical protein